MSEPRTMQIANAVGGYVVSADGVDVWHSSLIEASEQLVAVARAEANRERDEAREQRNDAIRRLGDAGVRAGEYQRERDAAIERAEKAEAALALEKAKVRANWKAALELWLRGSEGKGNCFFNWIEQFTSTFTQAAPEPVAEPRVYSLHSEQVRDVVAADQVGAVPNAFGNVTGRLPELDRLRVPQPPAEAPSPDVIMQLIADVDAIRERLTKLEGIGLSLNLLRQRVMGLEARDCPTRADVEAIAIRLTALERTGAWTSKQVEAIAREVVLQTEKARTHFLTGHGCEAGAKQQAAFFMSLREGAAQKESGDRG